jgi:predicted ester cyclase
MSSGEHFLGEGIFGGTHTGPLETPQGDIPATGRKVKVKFAFILDVTPEGLIAEDRSYFDSASMMSQLGLT